MAYDLEYSWSYYGRKAMAIAFTLIETAKLKGVDPQGLAHRDFLSDR